jgi:hypothetical protein
MQNLKMIATTVKYKLRKIDFSDADGHYNAPGFGDPTKRVRIGARRKKAFFFNKKTIGVLTKYLS